jgi:hypothetical protein
MRKVDMSANAVTARLKRVAQLRRLCLSLRKAKPHPEEHKGKGNQPAALNTQPDTTKVK